MNNLNTKALSAEVFGTFWLVLGGCGAAIFAANAGVGSEGGTLGIGFLGVSLAFGLTVLTAAYAVGHISGGHFNPAVTLGLVAGGRFESSKALPYIVAQVIGGLLAAVVLAVVFGGLPGSEINPGAGTFATNGYGEDGSPFGFSLTSAFIIEVVLTAGFLMVILGATAKKAAAGMGGLAIGLALTLIHLISIPITNTSVNPARSTSQAVIAAVFGNDVTVPLQQLWLFWVAPIIGGVLGALLYRSMMGDNEDTIDLAEPAVDAREVTAPAPRVRS